MSLPLLLLFKEYWRGLIPPLTQTMLDLAKIYAKAYPQPLRPYEAYLKSPYQLSTVYKATRSLNRKRLILCGRDGCVASVKAPIALLYHDDLEGVMYVRSIWGLNHVGDESLLAYLALLGAALKKLGFGLTEAYICPREGPLLYIQGFIRGGYSSLAKTLGVPNHVLRLAYKVHAEIATPYMSSIDGIKVLIRRDKLSVHVIAAKCPRQPTCGHELPDECPLVREVLKRLS